MISDNPQAANNWQGAAGADYGSKLAGTTVLACWEAGRIMLLRSKKGADADAFLLQEITQRRLHTLMLDAPLSLPGVYRALPGCEDYFYRACDRSTGAMSPMFLGGLTARAMRLAAQLRAGGAAVVESYPAWIARLLGLGGLHYKEGKAPSDGFCAALQALMPEAALPSLPDWHSADALLCLLSARRYLCAEAQCAGQAEEGEIWA